MDLRRPIARLARMAWLALASCALPAMAGAGTAPASLQDYDHLAWTLENGAPGDVWDMRQGSDGALWLATGSGLYRFDGQRFSRRPPPAGTAYPSINMTTLLLDPAGGFWIAAYDAGVFHLDARGLRRYGPAQGMPATLVPSLAYDRQGRLWAANAQGLRWFDGTGWQAPPAALGYPDQGAYWLLLSRTGTLWIAAGHRLYYLPAGASRFLDAGQALAPYAVMAQAPDGTVWVADRTRGLLPVADDHGLLPAGQVRARSLPGLLAQRIVFSRDGCLWASRYGGGGIVRVAWPAAGAAPDIQGLDVDQGLPSTLASALLQDSEGDLWVATNRGIARLLPHVIHRLAGPQAQQATQLLPVAGTSQVYAHGLQGPPWPLERPAPAATAGPAPPTGPSLWTWHAGDLQHWRNGQLLAPAPAPGNGARHWVRAYLGLGEQATACLDDRGVFTLSASGWTPVPALPQRRCSALAGDGQGALAVGYDDGRVAILQAAGATLYGPAQGLAIGRITGLYRDAHTLLAGGEDGLALLGSDGRFHTVTSTLDTLLLGINGIVRDHDERFWLYGIRGLVRVGAADLARSARTGMPLQEPRLFDGTDGLPGLAMQASPVPTLALAGDGLLWMASNQGLAWLDTRQSHRNDVPPRVTVDDITYGAVRQPLVDGLMLPKRTTEVEIAYSAAGLARPRQVHYRVRLMGLEDTWREVGDLTRMRYANLEPGRYTFEVMAANEDGVWSAPRHAAFGIRPALVQTVGFKLAVVAVLAALAMLAIGWRSRELSQRWRVRLEERHRERERIARDLHDTLLQGMQGLVLRLHAANQRQHPDAPMRQEVERIMDLAEDALREARERVTGLREAAPALRTLAPQLLQAAQELAPPEGPSLRLLVEGDPRALDPHVGEEVFLIGREALANAIRHAHADAVEIEVGYARRALSLRVRDDGRGLPARAEPGNGHFGLAGMRERAGRIGATLHLWSAPGMGTEVALKVPAVRAYATRARRWWPRRPGPHGAST